MNILALKNPVEPIDVPTLEAQGGFAWWYLDFVDPHGSGFVLIWSFGLPFLPGSRHRGKTEAPLRRPSLNLAIYGARGPEFYVLEEEGPLEASMEAESGHFGSSTITTSKTGGRSVVRADLDLAIPGSVDRLKGHVTLEGSSPTLDADPSTAVDSKSTTPPHFWSPLSGPATVDADFEVPGVAHWRFNGLGYHDRNGATRPLEELGLARWSWGRIVTPKETLVYYLLWPTDGRAREDHLFTIDALGRFASYPGATIRLDDPSRSFYGVHHARRVDIWLPNTRRRLRIDAKAEVDDGPFYLRTIAHATGDDLDAPAVVEWVDATRVDLARHRPFVRMRVHRTSGGNSQWLPLFSGPRRGRLERLFRSWAPSLRRSR